MFYVGQKVVCIEGWDGRLEKGHLYTVSKLGTLRTGEPGLDVEGIPTDPGDDVNWRRNRFRPIVERKTDISIFTDMLKPKHVEVQA